MSQHSLLRVEQLSKAYRQGFCLQAGSFSLAPGRTVAFLGANGAGKSTLFQLLSANLRATSGKIYFHGKPLLPENYLLKRDIGYLLQNLQLPPWISGRELLYYAASLYQLSDGKKRVEAMLDYWDCQSFATTPLAACSHGMQKRVALALAMLHEPSFLILDEPFSGLDLHHTRALEKIIASRQNAGKLTILSTHIIPYVARKCQDVWIVRKGVVSFVDAWGGTDDAAKEELLEGLFFGK